MNVRRVLGALRMGWWLVAVGAVAGGLAALLLVLVSTPLYTSSTQLFVSSSDTTSTAAAFQGSQLSQQRVASYARLLAGEDLAGRVAEQLDLDLTVPELQERIDVSAVPETVLLEVAVEDPSPEQAQRIAGAIGTQFPRLVESLESTPAGPPPVAVTVVDRADLPLSPSSPRPVRDGGVGLLAGLVLGAGAALGRDLMDRSITDPEAAEESSGAPVIGVIVRDPHLQTHPVLGLTTETATTEGYRKLRTNLQFLSVDDPPKVVMVTSALPSEGKSTLAVNLAVVLADAGHSVVLVEADLRRPKVTRYLGMVGDVGLTNVLAGTADLEDVLQRHGATQLSVVAAGPTPPNPGELLASSQMSALLDKLRGRSDYVLVDAPPLLPVADSAGLAVHVDGVLLAVRHGTTRREQLAQAAATLERVGARTLGVVLNIVPPKSNAASGYGYGYGDRGHDGGAGHARR